MNNFYTDKNELLNMITDTAELVANKQVRNLETAISSNALSDALVSDVEFWSWMNRNYSSAGGGMFSSNGTMKEYIKSESGKAMWMEKQLQGKGYEFDWVQKQRHNFLNIFKKYDLGDVSNQPAIDVIEKDLLTGKEKFYQMKAYTSKSNPNLHNTGKDVKVVTNTEKVDIVRENGYQVESYKNSEGIKKDVLKRQESIESGTATPTYNIGNVSATMAKAGLIGAVIGMGTESVLSYKRWKNNEITDEEYLEEVLKSGGESAITSGASAGVMIFVNKTIEKACINSAIGIPIAIAVTAGIDKIIAPCFGRGDYKKVLLEAKYYQAIESMYVKFMEKLDYAAREYEGFVNRLVEQNRLYNNIREKDRAVTKTLKDLYDSI